MSDKLEKKTDFWGSEYTEYRDANGRWIRNYEVTDWTGRKYIEHRTASGEYLGRSDEYETWLGEKYMEHTDAGGNKVGTSRQCSDWLGNSYTEHRDTDGEVTGTSRMATDWLGNPYQDYKERERRKDSGSSSSSNSSGSSVYSGGCSSGGGGYSGGYGSGGEGVTVGDGSSGWLVLCLIGLLLLSGGICFLGQNSEMVSSVVRFVIGLCLAPVMMLFILIACRWKRGDHAAVKQLKKKGMLASFLLLVSLQLYFLFYTDPNVEGSGMYAFSFFLGCWGFKLIYSIYCGVVERHAKKKYGSQGIPGDLSLSGIHALASGCFAAVSCLMEFINALSESAFQSIFDVIFVGIPATLLLIGVVALLLAISSFPYRILSNYRPR